MLIYLLMAVVLFFRPAGLFPREAGHERAYAAPRPRRRAARRRPRPARWRGASPARRPVGAAAVALLRAWRRRYSLSLGARVMIFAIAALSLELLIGVGGLVSFGHAAFLGVGAYAAGILASHGRRHAGDRAAGGARSPAALFALVTGAIAVRTRGVYFIMITLAFGQMAFFVATSLAPYGGDDGLTLADAHPGARTRCSRGRHGFYYVASPAWRRLLAAAPPRRLALRPRAARRARQRGAHAGDRLRRPPYRLTAYVIAGAAVRARGLPARQPDGVRQPRLHALAALGRADHDGAARRRRHALRPDPRCGRLPAAGGRALAPRPSTGR